MTAGQRLKVGEKVYVKGSRLVCRIVRFQRDGTGGVLLNRPIEGFRLWNYRDLRRTR